MSADRIGAGGSAGFSAGIQAGGASRTDIEGRLNRLKQERDKLRKENGQQENAANKKRINELEQRINNLRQRLDKLKDKQDECQTCKNRKYQDGSDDPGVSFKTAGKIAPEAAEATVRGHENEHVTRDRAEAEREGREVVSQNVRIKHAICPECGKDYVAGGVTETVTRKVQKTDSRFEVGLNDTTEKNGRIMNVVA